MKKHPPCAFQHTTPQLRQKAKKPLSALILALLLLPFAGKSQSTCQTAAAHTPSINLQWTTITPNASEYWLTFVGDTSTMYYATVNVADTASTKPELINATLYSGSCTQLVQLVQDSVIIYDSIIQGQQYFLKLLFTAKPDSFNLQSLVSEAKDVSWNCPSNTCDNIVQNSNFLSMANPNFLNSFNSPFTFPHLICAWGSYHLTPLANTGVATPPGPDAGYANMFARSNGTTQEGEGIFQNITLPAGTYDVGISYKRGSIGTGSCDHLLVDIAPQGFNALDNQLIGADVNALNITNINNTGSWTTAIGSFTNNTTGAYRLIVMPYQDQVNQNDPYVMIDNIHVTRIPTVSIQTGVICGNNATITYSAQTCYQTLTSIAWNYGDGQTSGSLSPSQTSTTHTYGSSGVYTVTLTLNYNYLSMPQTRTYTKQIHVGALTVDITGNHNTCSATSTSTYSISNPDPNQTYQWAISPANGGTITYNNTSATVVWNNSNLTNATPAYVNVTDACGTVTSFKVWKCCQKPNTYDNVYANQTITSNFPDGVVYINGTVTIDSDIAQSNTKFIMGQEAKIIVNAPYTFTVSTSNSTFTAGCNYMWDGIYTGSTQSKVRLSSAGEISGAINAVNSTNGGNFEITNSTFKDNYIAIKVTGYHPFLNPTNHPGIVYGSTFKNVNGLIAPYAGQKSYTGIYTYNVYELTIGSNAQAENTFDNLFCGVQSYNSYITLNKNTFQNIKRTSLILCPISYPADYISLVCETAVHVARIQQVLTYSPVVRLTSDITNQNKFTNCDKAYYGYKALQTVSYNTINTTTCGILCRDMVNGSTFANNTINGAQQGIYIINALPEVKNTTIKQNDITGVPAAGFGISITNCKSDATNKVDIHDNTIGITGNSACKGIVATGCDYISINGNNQISCAALNTSATRTTNRGISVSDCPNSMVKGNVLTRLGTGIWAEGLQTGTQFQCNTLTQNYYGFYLPNSGTVATVYNNQGTSAMPNDNQWTDHPSPDNGINTYRITGDANSTIYPSRNWYYRAGTNSYYPNVGIPNPATSFAAMSQLPSNYPSPCGSKGGDDENTANTDSTSIMETIIPDSANLAVQMRYLYMSMLFSSNAEQFATEISQDGQGLYLNIPLIAKINELAQNDTTIDSAIVLNNMLAPVNEMETYRKFVNAVYLNNVVKEIQPSTELIDELYTIADMAPNIGGEAVYIARAILNYDPELMHRDNIIIPLKTAPDKENIQYYPNPASDVLTVVSTGNFAPNSKIELYDITGRLVFGAAINSESSNTSISLKDIKQGLYLCVIKNGEKIISSSKISVIKQ